MTAQAVAETPRRLPRDPGLPGLYAGALVHLAGRVLRLPHRLLRAIDPCECPAAPETARSRAVAAGHPSALPKLAPNQVRVTPYRAVLGHGASEGDPDL